MELHVVRDGKTVCKTDDPVIVAKFINRHPKEKQKDFEVGIRLKSYQPLILIPAKQLLFRGIVGPKKIEKIFNIIVESHK